MFRDPGDFAPIAVVTIGHALFQTANITQITPENAPFFAALVHDIGAAWSNNVGPLDRSGCE